MPIFNLIIVVETLGRVVISLGIVDVSGVCSSSLFRLYLLRELTNIFFSTYQVLEIMNNSSELSSRSLFPVIRYRTKEKVVSVYLNFIFE